MPVGGLIINDSGSTASHPFSLQIDGLDVLKQAGSPGNLYGVEIESIVLHEVIGLAPTLEFELDDPTRSLSLSPSANVYFCDFRGRTNQTLSGDYFLGNILSRELIDDGGVNFRWQIGRAHV